MNIITSKNFIRFAMTVNTSPQSERHCDILNAVSTKFSEEAISKYSSGSNFTD
jgi:hypothetical protein